RAVPWVPVLTAPASAWRSMSPMFAMLKPASSSGWPRSAMRVPAQTVAVPAWGSVSTRPLIASSETRVPSVAQSGGDECPLPATRTGPALSETIAASAASSAGLAIRAGAQLTLPDQFRHVSAIVLHPRRALADEPAHARRLDATLPTPGVETGTGG